MKTALSLSVDISFFILYKCYFRHGTQWNTCQIHSLSPCISFISLSLDWRRGSKLNHRFGHGSLSFQDPMSGSPLEGRWDSSIRYRKWREWISTRNTRLCRGWLIATLLLRNLQRWEWNSTPKKHFSIWFPTFTPYEGMLVHSFFDMPLLPTGSIPVLVGMPAPSAILFSIHFPVLSMVLIPVDLIPFDDYLLPLLILLRSRLEEGRSARSSYPVSDWTGMKLVFSLAWIGYILAQRVAHLSGTDGLGR